MEDSLVTNFTFNPDGKIYCANCVHCLLVKSKSSEEDDYQLRVRCAAGMWKKKLGEEKYYKYFTVTRRKLDSCEFYESMGDEEEEFIRDLKKKLPISDEVYKGE